MATQFDPIAKDESLNTTEVTPRNIADVLAEELSAIVQAIADGSTKVKALTYSVTTGNSNTHYFNSGTANIAMGSAMLSSHANYPSTAVGAVAVSARSSSGYSIALPAIVDNSYVVAYGSANMTVNVSVLVFYT